mgnify:CR=1 FL=1
MENDYPYKPNGLDLLFYDHLAEVKAKLNDRHEVYLKEKYEPEFDSDEKSLREEFIQILRKECKELFILAKEEGEVLENQPLLNLYNLARGSHSKYKSNKLAAFFRDSRKGQYRMLRPEQKFRENSVVEQAFATIVAKSDEEIVALLARRKACEVVIKELEKIDAPPFSPDPWILNPFSNEQSSNETREIKRRKSTATFTQPQAALFLLLLIELSEADVKGSEGFAFTNSWSKADIALLMHLVQGKPLPSPKLDWNISSQYNAVKSILGKIDPKRDYQFILDILDKMPIKSDTFLGQLKELIVKKMKYL